MIIKRGSQMLTNNELKAMFHVELSKRRKIENALDFLIEKSKTEGRRSAFKEIKELAELKL